VGERRGAPPQIIEWSHASVLFVAGRKEERAAGGLLG
jgi:hypothetical protein